MSEWREWIDWNFEHIRRHVQRGELRAAIQHYRQARQMWQLKDRYVEMIRQRARDRARNA